MKKRVREESEQTRLVPGQGAHQIIKKSLRVPAPQPPLSCASFSCLSPPSPVTTCPACRLSRWSLAPQGPAQHPSLRDVCPVSLGAFVPALYGLRRLNEMMLIWCQLRAREWSLALSGEELSLFGIPFTGGFKAFVEECVSGHPVPPPPSQGSGSPA